MKYYVIVFKITLNKWKRGRDALISSRCIRSHWDLLIRGHRMIFHSTLARDGKVVVIKCRVIVLDSFLYEVVDLFSWIPFSIQNFDSTRDVLINFVYLTASLSSSCAQAATSRVWESVWLDFAIKSSPIFFKTLP